MRQKNADGIEMLWRHSCRKEESEGGVKDGGGEGPTEEKCGVRGVV